MEFARGMYCMIFLVTFFGSTWSFLGEGECNPYPRKLYEDVFQEGNNCAELGATPTTAIELQQAKTVEDYRKFFRGYCLRQAIVRDCLSNKTLEYQMCRNETYVSGFNVYRGFLETLLDIECTGESARLATFWPGLHFLVMDTTELAKIMPCLVRTLGLIQDMETSNVDIASIIFIFHKEMQWFKGCVHQGGLNGEFKEVVDVFLTEIVNRMKCINPRDGKLEICSTIDASLIRKTSACSIKTRNDELAIYEGLEDESVGCLNFLFSFNHSPFSEFVDKDLLERICSEEKLLTGCVSRLRTYSVMCMNVTQQREFDALTDSIRSVFDASCGVGGSTRIVEVLHEVYRLQNIGHGNAVLDCVDVAKSARNDENTTSSKNLRFYRELASFKRCLVAKLGGDVTSVVAATSLIDEALGTVKCVHPENGNTVPCKSIGQKVQVGNQG